MACADVAAALRTQADALRALADAIERPADEPQPVATSAPPALLDRRGIAAALGVSLPHLDKLTRAGLPFRRLGSVKRFVLADVLRFLDARAGATPLRAAGSK